MFLKHFLEKDTDGRLFYSFHFFEGNAIKPCIQVISGKMFDFY